MGRKEVSAQELMDRAKAQGYTQGVHREADRVAEPPKYVAKTLRDQEGVLKLYRKWREGLAEEESQPGTALPPKLEPGSPPPDVGMLMDFVRFHAAIGKGKIAGRITADSSNTFMEWFFAGFQRVTGSQVPEEDRKKVYALTRTMLAGKGLVVNKKKLKLLFGKAEFVRFCTTLWTTDVGVFVHPRNKIQVAFLVAIFCWTGARIGAFLPTSKEKHKRGLRYKDINLRLMRAPGGGKRLVYQINQRWVKNNRNPDNQTYGAATYQDNRPLYDDTQFLLAMALADNALFSIRSVEDLYALEIPERSEDLELVWNPEVRELPILRNPTMKKGVREEALTSDAFSRVANAVWQKAGYLGTLTVHSMRRAVGKKIDETYTEVQRSQHLTQQDTRVFGDSYVANTSSVAGMPTFLGEAPKHDVVEFFQSFEQFRESGLPTCLPAERKAAVGQHPELLALKDSLNSLTRDGTPLSDIKAARSKLNSCRQSLMKKALREYQTEWVRDRRNWTLQTRGQIRPKDDTSADLHNTLSLMIPELGRLAQTMISDEVKSDEERKEYLKDLHSFLSRDYSVVYRPGEEPIDGLCPSTSCSTELENLPKDQRCTHIHHCRRRDLACKLERQPPELRYCYLCFDWFTEEKWEEHCRSHLNSLSSKRCGPITYCGTLIRPGFCPFCIGQHSLNAEARLQSWTRVEKLSEHIESHLRQAQWPQECPFPLCGTNLGNRTEFLNHLSDVHSLKIGALHRSGQQQESSNGNFVNWDPDSAGRKRKRTPDDAQLDDSSVRRRRCQSLEPEAPAEVRTISPLALSVSPTTDATLCHLPELIYSDSVSPPDTESLGNSPDDEILFSTCLRSPSPEQTRDEMGRPCLPSSPFDSNPTVSKVPSANDDELLFPFLGAQSQSEEAVGVSIGPSRPPSPGHDASVPIELDSGSLDSADYDSDVIVVSPVAPAAKKPRIILKVRPPAAKVAPKIRLKLSNPQRGGNKPKAKATRPLPRAKAKATKPKSRVKKR